MEKLKQQIIERIGNEIERKIMTYGHMGTESVNISIELSDEEKEAFKEIDKYDNEHYSWDIEDNALNLSYTEEV